MYDDRFKFRVWCEACNGYVSPIVLTIDDDGYIRKGHMDTDDGYGHNESMTIEQFTGLLDANGMLIYEGDILRYPGGWWGDDEVDAGHVVVEYCIEPTDSGFIWGALPDSVDLIDCVIVGNVHENPELLEACDHRKSTPL